MKNLAVFAALIPNPSPGRRRASAIAFALVIVAGIANNIARAAEANAPATSAKEKPVTLEAIPGSPVKKVTLSARAAERIDVKTGTIDERVIVPTLMVGGIVVDPSAAAIGAAAPAADQGAASAAKAADGTPKAGPEIWIRVPMSKGELGRLAKDKPVRIMGLATRNPLPADLTAAPSGLAPQDIAKSGMTTLFYVVRSAAGGLVTGDRVRVELPLEAGGDRRKVVPYSAVYYDAKGDAWVYVQTAPLTFVRERVSIERVVGSVALLATGPQPGTPVVTTGAALLYGTELFGK